MCVFCHEIIAECSIDLQLNRAVESKQRVNSATLNWMFIEILFEYYWPFLVREKIKLNQLISLLL